MFFKRLFPVILALYILPAYAQQRKEFSRAQYLHGKLTPLRTSFDVKRYEITVKVEPERKYISGCNEILFLVTKEFSQMQLDLFSVMGIDSMVHGGRRVSFTRDSNAVFVDLGAKVKKGSIQLLKVYFRGNPTEAKRAPWDGGFVWAKDSMSGTDWVGLACEGIGASCWLPCKDHLSDEAESMKMHLIVPSHLVGVSNGRLTGKGTDVHGFTQYDWEVKNTINNYNITINIGNYTQLHDVYVSKHNTMNPELSLDYYILKGNKAAAREHFRQVHGMLECFESRFGTYPFSEDGYKLVETPYWGMEHQSAIAYGNEYRNNKWGFDFIVVHESGHEWFGNSLSCNDPADMWIHESFTTYSEALYVECMQGYTASVKYLKEQRGNIKGLEPMIGPYDVYYHGRSDNDIYYKGSWMLHTLRSVVDNDSAWFRMLRELNFKFYRKNVTTADIIRFFSEQTKMKLEGFFRQYLYEAEIPQLEYRIREKDNGLEVRYRWTNTVSGFELPVKMTVTKENFEFVTPTRSWQLIDLNFFSKADFHIQTDRFLMNVKQVD